MSENTEPQWMKYHAIQASYDAGVFAASLLKILSPHEDPIAYKIWARENGDT